MPVGTEAKREAHKSPHRQRALDLLSKSCLLEPKKDSWITSVDKDQKFFCDSENGPFLSGQFASSVTKKDVEGQYKVC